MKKSVWLMIVLVCTLVSCGPASVEPTAVPAPAEPTVVPAGPTVQPKPSETPAPAGPSTRLPTDTPIPTSPTAVPAPAGWWEEAVFYEIFVRSFYDSNGDGIGDLPGLIEKLDYLNDGDPNSGTDLGVTGLWLMPIFVSPSYHGYDVVDYTTVNPDYGTADDFRRLMAEAHQRGMHIIIDLVLNHTSDQHPWFLDSASGPNSERREWYVWSQTDPGYRGPWGEPVWHYRNGAYYYGVFWSGMPDLNLENPEVTAELKEVARFWLEEMGADGFRLDAARHYIEDGRKQVHRAATHAWLQDFYSFSKGVKPEMMTVGEIYDVSDAIATYVPDDMDLAFEFSLAKSILLSVNEGGATALASAMKEIQRLYPEGGYAPFLTNHDQNRVMDVLGGDEVKARLAATILLTLPGVPFLYYGEEIGMTGSKPDELIRTPMQWTSQAQAGFSSGVPWEPINGDYEARNVEAQSAQPDSLLNHYRQLVALRTAHPALRGYAFQAAECSDPSLYAYVRYVEGEAILVVLNLGGKSVAEYAVNLGNSSLAEGHYLARDLLTGTEVAAVTVEAGGGVTGYQPLPQLEARRALVLRLEPERP